MTLSARIAIATSRWATWLSAVSAIGGSIAVSLTGMARWPDHVPFWLMFAMLCLSTCGCAARIALRRTVRHHLTLSDRPEIDVATDAESGDEESWRLAATTMIWTGFSVVALVRSDGDSHKGRLMRLPVFDAEQTSDDRRSLSRFLLWSLRGGASAGTRRSVPADS